MAISLNKLYINYFRHSRKYRIWNYSTMDDLFYISGLLWFRQYRRMTKDLSPEAMKEFQKNMTKKFKEVLDGQVTLQLYNGSFSLAC